MWIKLVQLVSCPGHLRSSISINKLLLFEPETFLLLYLLHSKLFSWKISLFLFCKHNKTSIFVMIYLNFSVGILFAYCLNMCSSLLSRFQRILKKLLFRVAVLVFLMSAIGHWYSSVFISVFLCISAIE